MHQHGNGHYIKIKTPEKTGVFFVTDNMIDYTSIKWIF